MHTAGQHAPSVPRPTGPATTRRRLLAASGGALVASTLGTSTAAHADEGDNGVATGGFAVITDTHASTDAPGRIPDLVRVMGDIASRQPAFVLHCGDISGNGDEKDFELYWSTVPASLKSKIQHVPGNHETGWNADALQAFRRNFGPTRRSFDAGGVHYLGVDPLVSLEGSYYFGAELLDWIKRDLQGVPHGTPTIMFNHFQQEGRYEFVTDSDEFRRLISEHNVRGVFAGHVHRWELARYNGVVQVVVDAVKRGPYYAWVEQKTGDTGPYLEVSQVTVAEVGDRSQVPYTQIPLGTPGGSLGPLRARTMVDGDSLRVTVSVPPRAGVTGADCCVFPGTGLAKPLPFVALTGAGTTYRGAIDIADLPPGEHRLVVRSGDTDGATYDDTARFDIPTDVVRVGWSHPMTGRLPGDLAQRDDQVVAVSVTGEVQSLRVTSRSAEPQWRTQLGGVYKGAQFSPNGDLVLVPSVDHNLYALDSADGRQLWRRDLGAPVMCNVHFATIDGAVVAFVAAGRTMCCVNLDGSVVWRADLGDVFTGEACCDGDLVFAGSGDGHVHGLDARTGDQVWRVPANSRLKFAYSAWASPLRQLPGGGLLVTTFTEARALDTATGDVRWVSKGLHSGGYTPPAVTRYGAVVFDGKYGIARLLDTDTGALLWEADVAPRTKGGGLVATTDPAVYWQVVNSGLLVRYDLAAQQTVPVLQVSTAFTMSTAALVHDPDGGDVLAVGGKDGRVHGLVGLDGAGLGRANAAQRHLPT